MGESDHTQRKSNGSAARIFVISVAKISVIFVISVANILRDLRGQDFPVLRCSTSRIPDVLRGREMR